MFLVMVLCVSRTWCLLRPFTPQNSRLMLTVVMAFFLSNLAQLGGMHMEGSYYVEFDDTSATCSFFQDYDDTAVVNKSTTGTGMAIEEMESGSVSSLISIFLEVVMILTYCLPLFVVGICSAISTYLLNHHKNSVNKMEFSSPSAKLLIKSRHKASTTILIFTFVYAFFNIPLVLFFIAQTVEYHCGVKFKDTLFYFDLKDPEYYFYFGNYIFTMSTVLNSAINPILYLWRMPDCRKRVLKLMETISRRAAWLPRILVLPKIHFHFSL